MVQQFDITARLNEEQLALVEAARGSIDPASFAREGVLWYAERIKTLKEQVVKNSELSLYAIDDLTPEDHIRLAAEAEADFVDIDEVLHWLDTKRRQVPAEVEAGK